MKILNISLIICFNMFIFHKIALAKDDFKTIRERVIVELMKPDINDSQVKMHIATINDDGTWPGIYYTDVSRTGFQLYNHAGNLVLLAPEDQNKSSQFNKSKKAKKAIELAIKNFVDNDYIYDNWWHNQIGIPNHLVTLMLIIGDKLPDEFMFSVSDISTIYDGQLKKATRGVGIKDGKYSIIRDEIDTLDKITKVRWNMVTFSTVELGTKEATLTDNGKTLYLKVHGPDNIQMKTWSTAPLNNYDPENPGTIMVGFECDIPAHTSEAFEVILVPKLVESEATFLNTTLNEW